MSSMSQSRVSIDAEAVRVVRDYLARGDGRRATEQFEMLKVPPRLDSGFVEYLGLLRELGQAGRAYKMALAALSDFPISGVHQKSVKRSLIELESIRSLIRLGAPREAAARLSQGRWSETVRQSKIFKMTALNSNVVLWRYREALPLIDELLNESTLSVYDERLLLTTKISALLFTGFLTEARAIFWPTYEMLLSGESFVLARRLLEVGAQLFWELNDSAGLSNVLRSAREFFSTHTELGGPTAEFFVERWQAMLGTCIGEELSGRERSLFKLKIEQMHARALELKSGEAVRDADLLAVLILRDQEKLERLYYMSTFSSFREYLARMAIRLGLVIPTRVVIRVGRAPNDAPVQFEIENGEFAPAGHLRAGSMSFRILSALLRDGYRPLRTAELYHEIFPNQVYDPLASDRRVQQAVRRMRLEILAMGIPFSLESNAGGYVIEQASTRLDLVITAEWLACDQIDRGSVIELLVLRRAFSSSAFDARAAAHVLKLPLRTVQLLLRQMTSEQLVARSGNGKSTRYCAAPSIHHNVRSSPSTQNHDQGRVVLTRSV